MYKIDLHTHSIISYDGGISKKQYKNIFDEGILDYIAVTDHNETRFAKQLNAEFGEKVIVGEEILTKEGEIIGLFLTKTIPAGMSAIETVRQIKGDGGLVYIPHPFETGRSGLQEDVLKYFIKDIDILEIFNGRGLLRGRAKKARELAMNEKLPMASSSDAHCRFGIGTALSFITKVPTKKTLRGLLNNTNMQENNAPLVSLLCPSINKIKNNLFLVI